ncbi:MAG: class I SAM-dependent methyltransferase [Clostridia bacterium]
MEYTNMAVYYDDLFSKKDYSKEVSFIKNKIGKAKNIIDIGCGTGTHMSMLIKEGYNVIGVDLSRDMVEIARKKTQAPVYLGNVLKFKFKMQFDAALCLFELLNHLKNKKQIILAMRNINKHLVDNGILIVDLIQPQESFGGKKVIVSDVEKVLTWEYDSTRQIEKMYTSYNIDEHIYKTKHVFKIVSIEEFTEIAKMTGFDVVSIHDNYSEEVATAKTLHNEFVLRKNKSTK